MSFAFSAGFVLFILLFVFELAVIEDFETADRHHVGAYFDEIETALRAMVERSLRTEDSSHHLAHSVRQKGDADPTDIVIDAGSLAGGRSERVPWVVWDVQSPLRLMGFRTPQNPNELV